MFFVICRTVQSYLSFTCCVGMSSLCVLQESPWQPVAVDHHFPTKGKADCSKNSLLWWFMTETDISKRYKEETAIFPHCALPIKSKTLTLSLSGRANSCSQGTLKDVLTKRNAQHFPCALSLEKLELNSTFTPFTLLFTLLSDLPLNLICPIKFLRFWSTTVLLPIQKPAPFSAFNSVQFFIFEKGTVYINILANVKAPELAERLVFHQQSLCLMIRAS